MELVAAGHLFALTGAALVGLGLYGFIIRRHPLRQLLAVNLAGAGVFLLLGGLGRGAAATDPVPQALVITGIVVAVALTAFGAALILRLAEERCSEGRPMGGGSEGRPMGGGSEGRPMGGGSEGRPAEDRKDEAR